MPDTPVTPPTAPGAGWTHVCERCGTRMQERQCKILCPRCGYVRDCSDP